LSTVENSPKSFNPSVCSHGYNDANIFFLGGFPSNEDLLKNASLVGWAETTISQLLRPTGINIKQCYRSTFIKEKLEYSGANGKKLKAALNKIDLLKYEELLFDEIKNVNPNVIVPFDDISLAAVFPHILQIHKPRTRSHWVDCYRGSILSLRQDFQSHLSDFIRVIPTIGPLGLNQDWSARSYVAIDYKRIADNRFKRDLIQEHGTIWIAKSYRDFSNFLERGLKSNDGFVTLDIETYCGLITCASVCFDGVECCVVPLSPFYYSEINKTDLALLWQLLAKLGVHKIPKCGQNFKYDATIFGRHAIIILNIRHDTMLKAKLLYPEFPAGLDFLTSIYTDSPYYKDEGKEFNPKKDSKERLLIYCGKDSLNTHIINKEQDKELDEEPRLKSLYYDEVVPTIIIYKDIDETGIRVDDDAKTRLNFKYEMMLNQNQSILRGLIGNEGFNARSPRQVGKLIYEELGYPKRTKTDEFGVKSYKTDKDTLDDLIINHGSSNKLGALGEQILNRVILCRKISMVLICINTPLHPDGTFRGVSNLGGTETGRSSFSKSLDEAFFMEAELLQRKAAKKQFKIQRRLGRSLQTISKHGFKVDDELFDDPDSSEIASDLRTMFVPRRNHLFVEGDGSQAEARVVCVLAEDWEGLADFDRKPKVHAKTVQLCFGIDANIVKSEFPLIPKIGVPYYLIGKKVKHAGNYDMEAFRLAQMTHLPLSECKTILEKFHAGNPRIRGVYHNEINQALQRTGLITNPNGRRRQFYGRLDKSSYKQAKAQIPQGVVSDLTKFTMWRIKEEFEGYMTRYRFLTEQHDGILAEVHKDYAVQYATIFKKHYERTINFVNCTLSRDFDLTIPAEMSISEDNWHNLKEVHL
jgi:DNA polymerase I-like protein with 3'-5' exonuclease and polymerase domains